MPFGLVGAPSFFQRRWIRCYEAYHSSVPTQMTSWSILRKNTCPSSIFENVFEHFTAAGLTLRGRKCHIGMREISYFEHVFSGSGLSPDPQKVDVVQNRATLTDATTIRQFLGLASYYWRQIPHLTDFTAPLHALTQKCKTAFITFKNCLPEAPVLTFCHTASYKQILRMLVSEQYLNNGDMLLHM